MERWLAAGLAPKARRRRAAGFRRRALAARWPSWAGRPQSPAWCCPPRSSSAAVSRPQPSLASLVAQARNLGHQIDVLSEQYDGLRIQLTEARAEAKTAVTTFRQDATRLVSGQAAIGQLAAESYMNGGTGHPAAGPHLARHRHAAQPGRDHAAAADGERGPGQRAGHRRGGRPAGARHRRAAGAKVTRLATAMAAKKQVIQGKVNKLNSAAFSQAMSHLPAHR